MFLSKKAVCNFYMLIIMLCLLETGDCDDLEEIPN